MDERHSEDVQSLDELGLLDWIEAPAPDRGIFRALPEGGWKFATWEEIADGGRRIAADLLGAGVDGGVVALLINDETVAAKAVTGILVAGATGAVLPTPATMADRQSYLHHLAAILDIARPSAVVVQRSLRAVLDAALEHSGWRCRIVDAEPGGGQAPPLSQVRRAPADLVFIQFTSGSTGSPKGVRIPWSALEFNLQSLRARLGWTTRDAMGTWLPLYHDLGLLGTLMLPMAAGSSIWQLPPTEFVRDPRRWLEPFGAGKATVTMAPTFGYNHVTRRVSPEDLAGSDFSGWRAALIGAERVTPDVVADFVGRLGPFGFRSEAVVPIYGAAETGAISAGVPGRHGHAVRLAQRTVRAGDPVEVVHRCRFGEPVDGGSWVAGCGVPVTGTEVDVVDLDGAVLGPGRVGELRIRGTSLTGGYQTEAARVLSFPEAGYDSGDVGFVLDGEVYVIGRTGNSVSIAGRNVFAEDIDATLATSAGLPPGRFATTLGTDLDGPQAAVLIIDTDLPVSLRPVIAAVRRYLGSRARIRVFAGARGAILRTTSGKPRRREMYTAMVESAAEPVFDSHAPAETVSGS
ncbi:AMP-binding protein [Nocardia takedensis]